MYWTGECGGFVNRWESSGCFFGCLLDPFFRVRTDEISDKEFPLLDAKAFPY